MFREFINEFEMNLDNLKCVSASEIGLDVRCGVVWIDFENGEIISKNPKALDYYGGFEYIDSDAIEEVGKYKIYMSDYDDRVQDAIDYYIENNECDNEDEDEV